MDPIDVSTPVNPSAGLGIQCDGAGGGGVEENHNLRVIHTEPGQVPLP